MIDTAVSGNLASAETFDARFRRLDEARWLASRYAPADERRALAALALFHQELLRALGMKEAMIGKIRIQWWRETVEALQSGDKPRRHDLSEELAWLLSGRAALAQDLHTLLDRFDEALDDHLSGTDHAPGGRHEARHHACEAGAIYLAARALNPSAAEVWREALEACAIAALSAKAGLPDATERFGSARRLIRGAPADLWPAVAHLATVRPGPAPGPLGQRLAVLSAVFWRRI
jgi:phytoene synthase